MGSRKKYLSSPLLCTFGALGEWDGNFVDFRPATAGSVLGIFLPMIEIVFVLNLVFPEQSLDR